MQEEQAIENIDIDIIEPFVGLCAERCYGKKERLQPLEHPFQY